MKFRLIWIDVTKNLQEHKQPIAYMPRPIVGGEKSRELFGGKVAHTGEFWVVVNPLNEPEIDWAPVDTGEVVPVFINAYVTAQLAKSMLVAVGVEMGFRAGYDLAKRCHKQPVEITLVVGKDCIETAKGFQYFLGVAIQVE